MLYRWANAGSLESSICFLPSDDDITNLCGCKYPGHGLMCIKLLICCHGNSSNYCSATTRPCSVLLAYPAVMSSAGIRSLWMAAELSTELCNLCFAAYVLLCQLHCLLLCGPCRRVREPATGPLFAESTVPAKNGNRMQTRAQSAAGR